MGDRFGTVGMGRKLGRGCAPFGGSGSRSNTMWRGPRQTDKTDNGIMAKM